MNADRFLRGTIESVIGQDFDSYEYIVIDGGSHDATQSIVDEYAAHNDRIRFLSGPDRGISDAMNKGVEFATGDILVFLHADDFFAAPTVLRRVAGWFEDNPAIAWLTGGIRFADYQGRPIRDVAARCYSYRRLLRGNIIFHPATFIKREAVIRAGGFSTVLKYAMDYDLWLRLGKIAPPYVVDDVLTCFRVHGGSRSCRYADDAFAEEWEVRKRALGQATVSYYLHFGYYLLKRIIYGRFFKRWITTEENAHVRID